MKVYQRVTWLGLLLLLAGQAVSAQVPSGAAACKKLAYEFMGQYFQRVSVSDARPYRLDVHLLPVVSPYSDHFDLRDVLSAAYITENQFASPVKVDSLLSPADFAAMRAQLTAWQSVRRWRAGRLRAAGVAVLAHDHRTRSQHLFPDFSTYQVFPPLFSRDGQLALLYAENFCGLNCGSGGVTLLRHQPDGSWKIVLGIPLFLS